MATLLDKYVQRLENFNSMIAKNELPLDWVLILQEVKYRICVLKRCATSARLHRLLWKQSLWAITTSWWMPISISSKRSASLAPRSMKMARRKGKLQQIRWLASLQTRRSGFPTTILPIRINTNGISPI